MPTWPKVLSKEIPDVIDIVQLKLSPALTWLRFGVKQDDPGVSAEYTFDWHLISRRFW